jgi:hypothetical protein
MNELMQMLADIGVTAEASASRLTIRAINFDLLHEWSLWQVQQEALEAWLEAERLRWYGSKEAELAAFCQWMRQAEAEWEEAEDADPDWLEGWYE